LAEDTESRFTSLTENSEHTACLRKIISTRSCGSTKREYQLHICTELLRKTEPVGRVEAAISGVEVKNISVIIFLHGLGRLTCSGIDALPSFPGAATISSPSGFVVDGVLRKSGVANYFEVVDPVLFVFESHVLYYRYL
jgi:hypothetical protein